MRFVGFDTETYLITPGRLVPRLVCVTTYADGQRDLHAADVGVNYMRRLLAPTGPVLVGHNVAYDLAVLCAASPDLVPLVFAALDAGRIRCTKVREKLLAIAEGRLEFDPVLRKRASYALDALVMRYHGVDISAEKKDPTSWRLRYAELDGVPLDAWPPAAREYALSDAHWPIAVMEAQGASRTVQGHVLVDDTGTVTNEREQTAADFALTLLSAWGVRTDAEAVAAWAEEIETEAAAGEAAGVAAGFVRADGTTDMKALRARVDAAYNARGAPVPTTPKDSTATDAETLEESGDPALEAYAAAGFARKQISTYLPSAQHGTQHPINAGYDVLKDTGRTSCFKPNLQNPPRGGGYRGCFVPRPGWLYCSVDYDTAELRAMAQVELWWFGTSKLAEALAARRDPHLDLAAVLLATSYDDVLSRKKEPAVKTMRQTAKPANFGFWGGMGATAFVAYAKGQGVHIDLRSDRDGLPSAHKLRDAWYAKWEPDRYFDRISQATRFGNAPMVQCRSLRIRGDVGYSQMANGYFQGLVADWSKAALWDVTHACYTGRDAVTGEPSPLAGCRPVLFLHDEIIAEMPADVASEAAHEMARVMIRAGQRYAPDVEITASPALMRRWYKGAEKVTDANGRLQPWEPA